MKKLFAFIPVSLAVAAVFISCKKEQQDPDTVIVKQERGYVCENFSCKFVETGATYMTLLDCKSDCADTRPGNLEFEISYTQYGGSFGSTSTTTINIYESADDMSVNAPLKTKVESTYAEGWATQPQKISFTATDLPQGKYYYAVYHLADTYSSSSWKIKTGFSRVPVNATARVTLDF